MKKTIIFVLFFVFALSAKFSLAETYPATCPAEAQSVLKAVKGCSEINCNKYSNICKKCCVKNTAPVQDTTKNAPTSMSQSVSQTDATNPFTNEQAQNRLKKFEESTSSDLNATTATTTEVATTAPETQTSTGFVGFLKYVFSGMFRFFGLVK